MASAVSKRRSDERFRTARSIAWRVARKLRRRRYSGSQKNTKMGVRVDVNMGPLEASGRVRGRALGPLGAS